MDDELYFEDEERPRDASIDVAKKYLLENVFSTNPDAVFYQRQLEIHLERKFFHWITGKALVELSKENKIGSEKRNLGQVTMIFYFNKSNRYYKRQAKETERLVLKFSNPEFARALGHQCEMLFDAALPLHGFMPMARNVREWNGVKWSKTKHDLDRIFVRNGKVFGVEYKNRLSYIDITEFLTKVDMCLHLQIIPLFIVRMAPANYINYVRERGGFTLIFEYQLYPYTYREFARAVREGLGIKVDCPARIEDGTILRLTKWADKLA